MSQAAPEGTSKALVRTVVGAVYAVTVVSCLFWGVAPTACVVSVMACMCCWEFLGICKSSGRMPNDIIALAATMLFPLVPLAPVRDGALVLTGLLVVACAAWYVATPRATIADVALTVFAPLYCGLTFSCLVMIRAYDAGFMGGLLAFGVIGSIWVNDTAAYFVGTRFGSRKLAPRISPNKSIEGFWGGIAGCVLIWVLMVILRVRGLTLLFSVPCGAIVGGMGVVGDLCESRVKRGAGIKDSGNLLPGHGGMLDRSDAILIGVTTAFMLLRLGGVV